MTNSLFGDLSAAFPYLKLSPPLEGGLVSGHLILCLYIWHCSAVPTFQAAWATRTGQAAGRAGTARPQKSAWAQVSWPAPTALGVCLFPLDEGQGAASKPLTALPWFAKWD